MPVAPIRIFTKRPDDFKGSTVAFTPSGSLLYATQNQIVEANVITGQWGRTWTAGKYAVISFALAPAAHRLAVLSDDGSIFLWDTRTNRLPRIFKLREIDASEIAISPDGRYLAVCGHGVHVYDLMTGRIRKSFPGLDAAVFAPDGKTLFLSGVRKLQSWNVMTWRPRRLREFGDMLTDPQLPTIDCSPDGKRIAIGMEVFRPDSTAFSALDAKTFAEVWNTQTGSMDFVFPVAKIVYSPSGKRLAVAFQHTRNSELPEKLLGLWDARTGKNVCLYDETKPIRSIDFSRNEKYLAALTDRVTVWPVVS